MNRIQNKLLVSALGLVLATLTGCSDDMGEGSKVIATGSALQVFTDVAGNPIPTTATAMSTGWDEGGKLKLSLRVAGFPPSRDFGAHLHKLPCADNKAGGHYQDMAAPTTEEVNTPSYANKANEAWLDFMTAADGTASVEATQSWLPRSGQAMSIIIHAMKTDDNGRAGDKLACLPINLP